MLQAATLAACTGHASVNITLLLLLRSRGPMMAHVSYISQSPISPCIT